MFRAILASASLLLLPLPVAPPAHAAQADSAGQQCDQSSGAQRRRSILGGVLGGIANRVTGGHVAGISLPTQMLSEAIIELLDCREQQQAATATDEAIRGGVGTTAEWTSESRANVRGSSTVTDEERPAGGGHCVTVTDIVIIDGEETRAPKRMCRIPPARGYSRA